MHSAKSIALAGDDFRCGGIKFTKVDVITAPPGPIAIVYYDKDGEPQDLGLRLDTGKQVFLDHVADRGEERKVVGKILDHIYAQLYAPLRHGASGD